MARSRHPPAAWRPRAIFFHATLILCLKYATSFLAPTVASRRHARWKSDVIEHDVRAFLLSEGDDTWSPRRSTLLLMGIRSGIRSLVNRKKGDSDKDSSNPKDEASTADKAESRVEEPANPEETVNGKTADSPEESTDKTSDKQPIRMGEDPQTKEVDAHALDRHESVQERINRVKSGQMTQEEKESFLDMALSAGMSIETRKPLVKPESEDEVEKKKVYAAPFPTDSIIRDMARGEGSTREPDLLETIGLDSQQKKREYLNMVTNPDRFPGHRTTSNKTSRGVNGAAPRPGGLQRTKAGGTLISNDTPSNGRAVPVPVPVPIPTPSPAAVPSSSSNTPAFTPAMRQSYLSQIQGKPPSPPRDLGARLGAAAMVDARLKKERTQYAPKTVQAIPTPISPIPKPAPPEPAQPPMPSDLGARLAAAAMVNETEKKRSEEERRDEERRIRDERLAYERKFNEQARQQQEERMRREAELREKRRKDEEVQIQAQRERKRREEERMQQLVKAQEDYWAQKIQKEKTMKVAAMRQRQAGTNSTYTPPPPPAVKPVSTPSPAPVKVSKQEPPAMASPLFRQEPSPDPEIVVEEAKEAEELVEPGEIPLLETDSVFEDPSTDESLTPLATPESVKPVAPPSKQDQLEKLRMLNSPLPSPPNRRAPAPSSFEPQRATNNFDPQTSVSPKASSLGGLFANDGPASTSLNDVRNGAPVDRKPTLAELTQRNGSSRTAPKESNGTSQPINGSSNVGRSGPIRMALPIEDEDDEEDDFYVDRSGMSLADAAKKIKRESNQDEKSKKWGIDMSRFN